MNKEYHPYTTSIPPVYHKGLYRFGSGILFSHGGAMKLFFPISASRLLCFALHWIALHCIVQSEAHFNLKLTALRSMRVQWICFFLCSVWHAFQLPDSTEIYENSVFVFQLVMHFSLSLWCARHSEEEEKRGPRLVSVTCLFGLYLGKGITKLWLYVCWWRLIGFSVAVKTASINVAVKTASM